MQKEEVSELKTTFPRLLHEEIVKSSFDIFIWTEALNSVSV